MPVAFRRINLRRTCLAITLSLITAGCGGQQGPSEKQAEIYMQGLGGRAMVLRPGTDANALYASGIALKNKGDCAGAVPKLRQVANLGPGYEDAQTALGECLVQTAGNQDLSSDYLEGLTWLRRAADGGWPEAQATLAYAHSLGPKAIRNTDEAAYWLALYQGNPDKSRIGFVPFPADRIVAIEATLTPAAKEAGEKRAAAWQRKVWMPPNSAAPPGPTSEPATRGQGFGSPRNPQ